MSEFLDFVNLEEALPLLVLVLLLWFLGSQMTESDSVSQRWTWRIAAAALLLYAAAGIVAWTPARPTEFVTLVLRAALAAGLARGISMILLPPLRFLYQQLSLHLAVKPKPQRQLVPTDIPLREERPSSPPETPPPSPTPEERAAAALARYEAKLQLLDQARLDETELRTAREHAKQLYLRELDELIQ